MGTPALCHSLAPVRLKECPPQEAMRLPWGGSSPESIMRLFSFINFNMLAAEAAEILWEFLVVKKGLVSRGQGPWPW